MIGHTSISMRLASVRCLVFAGKLWRKIVVAYGDLPGLFDVSQALCHAKNICCGLIAWVSLSYCSRRQLLEVNDKASRRLSDAQGGFRCRREVARTHAEQLSLCKLFSGFWFHRIVSGVSQYCIINRRMVAAAKIRVRVRVSIGGGERVRASVSVRGRVRVKVRFGLRESELQWG